MSSKITLFIVLLFCLLRDNTCSSTGGSYIYLYILSGHIVNNQLQPVSSIKVLSIYTDTTTFRERLDSSFSDQNGYYRLFNGFPDIQTKGGRPACGEGEPIVTDQMANFLLVFIDTTNDTTIAAFRNGISIPIQTSFARIDTFFAKNYFDRTYNTFYAPTIILKKHYL